MIFKGLKVHFPFHHSDHTHTSSIYVFPPSRKNRVRHSESSHLDKVLRVDASLDPEDFFERSQRQIEAPSVVEEDFRSKGLWHEGVDHVAQESHVDQLLQISNFQRIRRQLKKKVLLILLRTRNVIRGKILRSRKSLMLPSDRPTDRPFNRHSRL